MEFDKSRIYGAVNADELKPGDKVIVSDCLRFLRQDVKEGGDIETLKEVLDESHLQRFKVMDDLEWGLAYLVERSENCTNCKEGRWDAEHKKILCDPVNCGNGNVIFRNHEIEVCEYYKPITKQKVDMPELTSLGNGQYIKRKHTNYNHCEEAKKACVCAMTNVCPNKHYRPFANTDELIKVWNKKFYLDFKPSHDPLTMPLIWVKNRETKLLIVGFGTKIVFLASFTQNGKITDCFLTELYSQYTFLDGTPCGVEE